jgi:hypothetical protein
MGEGAGPYLQYLIEETDLLQQYFVRIFVGYYRIAAENSVVENTEI